MNMLRLKHIHPAEHIHRDEYAQADEYVQKDEYVQNLKDGWMDEVWMNMFGRMNMLSG